MKNIISNKYAKLLILSTILVCIVYMLMPKKKEAPPQPQYAPEVASALLKASQNQKEATTSISSQQATVEPQKEKIPTKPPGRDYPAGATIDRAWKTYKALAKDNPNYADYGIYTEMSKVILRESEEIRHEYYNNSSLISGNQPYKVFQKGYYAVISVENINTKEKYPFLFCKKEDGWKFDLVNQRRAVRFGEGVIPGVERFISPYSPILRRLPLYSGIDIPMEKADTYRIADDTTIAKRVKELEILYNGVGMTMEQAFELARLYTITSLNAKAIYILDQLKTALPNKADIFKYSAIAHVNANYDYQTAIQDMEKYVELEPGYEYGHNFLGYLYSRNINPMKAESEFERALQINRRSCYAAEKLAPIYYQQYVSLSDLTEEKYEYLEKFNKLVKNAGIYCTGLDYERFVMLMQWKHSDATAAPGKQAASPGTSQTIQQSGTTTSSHYDTN